MKTTDVEVIADRILSFIILSSAPFFSSSSSSSSPPWGGIRGGGLLLERRQLRQLPLTAANSRRFDFILSYLLSCGG